LSEGSRRHTPICGHRYATPYGQTIFFEDTNGKIRVTAKNGENVWFTGPKIEPLLLGEPSLKTYVGESRSAELDATYTVSIENGSLVLHNGWNPPMKLETLPAP
jgi:hypothetical protein